MLKILFVSFILFFPLQDQDQNPYPRIIIKSQVVKDLVHKDPILRVGRYQELELNQQTYVKTTFGYFIAPHLIIVHKNGLEDGYDMYIEAAGILCKVLTNFGDYVLLTTTEKGLTQSELEAIKGIKQVFRFTTLRRVFYNSKQISTDKLDQKDIELEIYKDVMLKHLNKCSKVLDWDYEVHGFSKPKC